jgi:hypothetical protein
MTADELTKHVTDEAARELNDALGKIVHCLDQLDDAQIAKSDLFRRLEVAVTSAKAALQGASGAELASVRRIQGFEVTGLGAIFHSVPHFRGHAQEIVHMTRRILGDGYRIQWQPSTGEQGAAS